MNGYRRYSCQSICLHFEVLYGFSFMRQWIPDFGLIKLESFGYKMTGDRPGWFRGKRGNHENFAFPPKPKVHLSL